MFPGKKPNLFLVGAPKSGTTAISEYLRGHPQVFFSALKEPNFFCTDFSPDFRACTRLDQYLRLFTEGGNQAVVAEGSVTYLFSETAVANVLRFNPEAKFVVCLRNPVDLVVSLHRQQLNNLEEDQEDFAIAWGLQEERKKGRYLPADNREVKLLYYRDWGLLGKQVHRLFQLVPEGQRHVILFDDIRRDAYGVYRNLLKFLGIPDDGREKFEVVNAAFRWRSAGLIRLLRYQPPFSQDPGRQAQKTK